MGGPRHDTASSPTTDNEMPNVAHMLCDEVINFDALVTDATHCIHDHADIKPGSVHGPNTSACTSLDQQVADAASLWHRRFAHRAPAQLNLIAKHCFGAELLAQPCLRKAIKPIDKMTTAIYALPHD